MNPIKTLGFTLFFTFVFSDSLSQKGNIERSIIKDESIKALKEFQEILNMLTYPSLSDFERGVIIRNSYTKNMNQIFLNDEVIVESDLDPVTDSVIKDMTIARYLGDFNLFYEKTEVPGTIQFSNFSLDTIYEKQGEKLAEVSFESLFKGKHIYRSEKYILNKRKATLLISYSNNALGAKILQISFNEKEVKTTEVAQTHEKVKEFPFTSTKDEFPFTSYSNRELPFNATVNRKVDKPAIKKPKKKNVLVKTSLITLAIFSTLYMLFEN